MGRFSYLTDSNQRLLLAFALAVVIFGAGSVAIEGFSSLFSIRSMLVLTAFLGIAAVGQTLVVLIGGIDLSIPFMIGFANVATAKLYGDGYPFELIVIGVLAAAALIGALNGFISARLGVHPLIITLGIGTAILGIVRLWTGGFPTGSAPKYVNQFVSIGGSMGPIPLPPLIPFWLIVALLIFFLLQRTIFGRQLYALGANPEAARLALVKPVSLWTMTFALSAVFASLAGILLIGFTGSAFADVGRPYLFLTIAAVVIGGTSMLGGRGNYLGTVIGAFVLIELRTLLIGLGLTEALVQAALGLVIIVLVSLYGRETHVRNQI